MARYYCRACGGTGRIGRHPCHRCSRPSKEQREAQQRLNSIGAAHPNRDAIRKALDDRRL